MTFDTAASSPYCGALVDQAGLKTWQAMCLHLLTERAAGPASRWAHYLATLPPLPDHPLLWTPEQQRWLQGSPTLARLAARIVNVQEDTELLLSIGANDLPIAKDLPEPLVSEASMRWAVAVLLSRAFYLGLEESTDHLADMPVDVTMPPDRYRPGSLGSAASALDDEDQGDPDDYYGSYDGEAPHVVVLVPWADLLNHASDATEESVLAFDIEVRAGVRSEAAC